MSASICSQGRTIAPRGTICPADTICFASAKREDRKRSISYRVCVSKHIEPSEARHIESPCRHIDKHGRARLKRRNMMFDEEYMLLAIEEAKRAKEIDEVPVGAVIVREGKVIARAHNTRERDKNALCHAEIKAIDEACRALGGWRLVGCTLYVTLEPCPMCAGAISNAHLERVVYGASDFKAGALGTVLNLNDYPVYKPDITVGVMRDECAQLLTDFFKAKRKKNGT